MTPSIPGIAYGVPWGRALAGVANGVEMYAFMIPHGVLF